MPSYQLGPTVAVEAVVGGAGAGVITAAWPVDGVITDTDFPDNCHTVLIYNSSATETLLVGCNLAQVAGAVTNGINIPPSSTITLAIGVQSERIKQLPSGGRISGFVYDGTAALTAHVTYVCSILK